MVPKSMSNYSSRRNHIIRGDNKTSAVLPNTPTSRGRWEQGERDVGGKGKGMEGRRREGREAAASGDPSSQEVGMYRAGVWEEV